jgi:hypothetical protein
LAAGFEFLGVQMRESSLRKDLAINGGLLGASLGMFVGLFVTVLSTIGGGLSLWELALCFVLCNLVCASLGAAILIALYWIFVGIRKLATRLCTKKSH